MQFKVLENCVEFLSQSFVGNDLLRYSDLRTVIGLTKEDQVEHPEIRHPYIMTTKNNDFVTVIEVQGAKSEFDQAGFNQFISTLATSLTTIFQKTGHKLSVIYERDVTKNEEELTNIYQPHINTTKRLGLDIVDLVADDAKKIAAHYSRERMYVVLTSNKSLLPDSEVKDEAKRSSELLSNMPASEYGQNPEQYTLQGLKLTHDAVLWRLVESLRGDDVGLITEVMDVRRAGAMMRQLLWRNSTSQKWFPRTPFDKGLRATGDMKEGSADFVLPPNLNIQLLPGDMESNGNIVECDGKFYSNITLELPPLHAVKFTQLFKSINRKIPYRVKFDFLPVGKRLNAKTNILSFMRFIPALKTIARDLDYVKQQNEYDPVTAMAVNFLTWGDTENECKRNTEFIVKSVQAWGVCDTSTTFGNPKSALIASIPAMTVATPGTIHYPPLSEGMRMLPFERPASPWYKNGNICFITEDGKLFPYQVASSLQEKFTDVITGVPGSGKSVLANRLNWSTLYRANNKLPYMTIIDKGYSSQGISDLLRDELPEDQRHLVANITLHNSEDHCINIFDTQLGSRRPTDFEEVFLNQMVKSFCIDPSTGMPPNDNDVTQVIGRLVKESYERFATDKAKKYRKIDRRIVEALETSGLTAEYSEEWFENATWWEITDLLFSKGLIYEATVAQRYAVPTLSDFISLLNDGEWKERYKGVNINGSSENVVNYVIRSLSYAVNTYKLFSNVTVFDFSPETRVTILDMQNVLGDRVTPAGKLKSGIMYMFARQMAVRNYYLPQSADTFIPGLPEQYRNYHIRRIQELSEEVKHTFYDECANFKGITFIENALNTADLEDRKFNVRTAFSSQYLSHMPESVLKTMNSVFLMRLSAGEVDQLKELGIEIPADVVRRFKSLPQGAFPDGSGTAFLGIFKTKYGVICHILKNTIGIKQLWALNSSARDRAIRKLMYNELGGKVSRNILANKFPNGTASDYVEQLLLDKGSDGTDEAEAETMAVQVAQQLIAEYRRGNSE